MPDGVTMELSGLNAVFKNLQDLGPAFESQIELQIIHATYQTLLEAQKNAPVKTGALRDSGEVAFDHLQGTVTFTGDPAHPYALYVEEGHHTRSGSFVAPALFLTPAWYHNADKLLKALENLKP